VQQVVVSAGLRAGPRQPVAAERLAPDHRPGRRAVDVEVADRRALDDTLNGARVAAEQPARQRDRQRVDAVHRLVDAGDGLDRQQRPEHLVAQHRRVVRQPGRDDRRDVPALARDRGRRRGP